MSFGLPSKDDEQRLTYGGYLKISELLNLQRQLSDPPQHDETLFIIIHQVYELWFKQLLHEIDTIIEKLNRDEALSAHRLFRRCVEIQRVLINQIAVLETMTPVDFLAFRDHLMPASGFQSSQFRELEFVSGLKDSRRLRNYEPGSDERARLEARLRQPTLSDAFYDMLRRRGFNLPADAESEASKLEAGGPESGEFVETESHRARIQELKRIYEEADKHYGLYLLAESLIEYDEMFMLWRLRHIKMVERMIGSKPGTGGSEGAGYLKRTVERRFFPDLWELRSYLSNKNTGY